MAMPVKLDEDLSPVVAGPLIERGYEVRTVHGQGWSGAADADLWKRLDKEGVFFITADKGFGDIRAYQPGTHAGMLVLRPATESIAAYRELLEQTLRSTALAELLGAVSVASSSGLRTRRPA
jgi:predicted nuclease of predicted toxin-antitoxin system